MTHFRWRATRFRSRATSFHSRTTPSAHAWHISLARDGVPLACDTVSATGDAVQLRLRTTCVMRERLKDAACTSTGTTTRNRLFRPASRQQN